MSTSNMLVAAEHLVGFLIVVVTLAILWGLTALMGKVVGSISSAHKEGKTVAPKPAQAPASEMDPTLVAAAAAAVSMLTKETSDELVVISAAVASMFGERHRIVSIRPSASSWGQQGRRDIHASHRIR